MSLNIDTIERIVRMSKFQASIAYLALGSFSNLVLLKLDTVLYANLAYAKGFTENVLLFESSIKRTDFSRVSLNYELNKRIE